MEKLRTIEQPAVLLRRDLRLTGLRLRTKLLQPPDDLVDMALHPGAPGTGEDPVLFVGHDRAEVCEQRAVVDDAPMYGPVVIEFSVGHQQDG